MDYAAINFRDKLGRFHEHWSPKVIAEMNDYQFKLVKVKGDFVWHDHQSTDEVFIVLDGKLRIAFRDGKVELAAGEMFVVPKGVDHRLRCDGVPSAAGGAALGGQHRRRRRRADRRERRVDLSVSV